MSTIIWIVILIVALAAGIGAGYFIGYNNRKKTAEAQIGSAEAEATRLVNEAIKTAEQKRKEAVLEAKDEAFKLKAEVDAQKAEADKEIKQRRAEISRQENRIDQKETALDRKTEVLEKKEEELKKRAAEAEERLAEIDALRAKEMERLETLAGLSQEDAREVLLHKVDEELTHEKAVRVAAYETDLKENCDNIARNLIGQAVSRCAADHCSETTVSVVPLPSDEMKGRIIGREGRNIRALETATGVDLIIDDTPEAITLSSFDQTRRDGKALEGKLNVSAAVGSAAVSMVEHIKAACIVTPTMSGQTARLISNLRPSVPIYGVTPYEWARRKMQLYWGVRPVTGYEEDSTENIISHAMYMVRREELVERGDMVIFTAGDPATNEVTGEGYMTNMLHIIQAK